MKILITGGCGFVGHHVVEHFLKSTDWKIYVLDKLTYASKGIDRLRDIDAFDGNRVKIYTFDLSAGFETGLLREVGDAEYVIHLAAETHVDNSIVDPRRFVIANVLGTCEIMNACLQFEKLKRFIYFSTDEVFGPAPNGIAFKEDDSYNCGNPYAATKAGGEQLAVSFHNTYKLPVIITHTMNCFGERQHPEKFIPKIINHVLERRVLPIHADPTKQISGSRFYIHCRNVANALHFLLEKGKVGEKYNIVGEKEISNYQLALIVADVIGKELFCEMVDFHSSRPGHDLRYALDGTKMEQLGWRVPMSFERSLAATVRWMLNRPEWLSMENYKVGVRRIA